MKLLLVVMAVVMLTGCERNPLRPVTQRERTKVDLMGCQQPWKPMIHRCAPCADG